MSYHLSTNIKGNFDEIQSRVIENLKDVGFGVITEINLKAKLKEKLDVDFKKYTILGACNPGFAHEAVQMEEELGVLLPCNVVLIDNEDGSIKVAAIDARKMMSVVGNEELDEIAGMVNERLKQALMNL
jgi:uncharacterized protein (DUF302 family)